MQTILFNYVIECTLSIIPTVWLVTKEMVQFLDWITTIMLRGGEHLQHE